VSGFSLSATGHFLCVSNTLGPSTTFTAQYAQQQFGVGEPRVGARVFRRTPDGKIEVLVRVDGPAD
jgi:hypothetical protein